MPRSYGMYELGSVSSWYLDGGILKPKLECWPGKSSRFLSTDFNRNTSVDQFSPGFRSPSFYSEMFWA